MKLKIIKHYKRKLRNYLIQIKLKKYIQSCNTLKKQPTKVSVKIKVK